MKSFRYLILLTLIVSQTAVADDNIRPYVLLEATYETAENAIASVSEQLESQGFTIAGQYSPFSGATVLGITNASLREIAAKTVNGGFGAAIRVSVTDSSEGVQVAYVNPEYMSNVYRMADLSHITEAFTAALGPGKEFGSRKGIRAAKLRKYHYMLAMPYFDDVDELADYHSYQAAIESIEANLAKGVAGTSLVYRIDISGKDETLYGVGISTGSGSDQSVISVADQGDLKHTAHLPYEILISGGKVLALRGRFRIAQSFPDLTMGTFMKIRAAPGAIKDALRTVALPLSM